MPKDIYLILTLDAGPYHPIRHLFPGDRIPVTAPFPIVLAGDNQQTPCFLIDAKRLTPVQRTALTLMLLEKYKDDPEMNPKRARAEIDRGLPISQKWRLRIEGDEDFASEEAQQWAFEFNQLSNEPSIDVRISPLAAWCLIVQLQTAARHPANTGSTAVQARYVADQIQSRMEISDTMRQFLDKGWDPTFDKPIA